MSVNSKFVRSNNVTGIQTKEKRHSIIARLVMSMIRFYQRFISPCFRSHCIYVPTCSEYAIQAIYKYGIVHGGWLSIKRVLRCHPFHHGGYDPVP